MKKEDVLFFKKEKRMSGYLLERGGGREKSIYIKI
jgi:hypothetical protein